MPLKSDYLKLLELDPEVTYFYHDQPILYTVSHVGDDYMVALAEENEKEQTQRFLLIQYPPETFNMLQKGSITIREFFTHPSNSVHNVLVEYDENDGPSLALGVPYEDNSTIPDEYLPTVDAPWLYSLDPE